jgi:hypothetical protein
MVMIIIIIIIIIVGVLYILSPYAGDNRYCTP